MKTRALKQDEIKPKTYIIDATNIRMGKLVAGIAKTLLGKDNVKSVRYIPNPDRVIVINANKFSIHPSKTDKLYYQHSGYMGGLHSEPLGFLMENKVEKVLRKSVWGMLPKNRFGRKCLAALTITNDSEVNVPEAIVKTVK